MREESRNGQKLDSCSINKGGLNAISLCFLHVCGRRNPKDALNPQSVEHGEGSMQNGFLCRNEWFPNAKKMYNFLNLTMTTLMPLDFKKGEINYYYTSFSNGKIANTCQNYATILYTVN